MEDVAPVQVGERLQELNQQLDLVLDVAPFRCFGDGLGRIEQVHRVVGTLLTVKPVVADADDMRMMERRQGLELLRQHGAAADTLVRNFTIAVGVALNRRALGNTAPCSMDSLERDVLAAQPVHGAIHRSHAALAELLVQGVFADDHRGLSAHRRFYA